jgi:hypothetical protein
MMRVIAPLLLALAATACGQDGAEATINAADPPGGARTLAELPAETPRGPLPATCHPAYWPCVPRAQDVDCLGQSNGPVLIGGPVEIITSDPYRLDEDGDGIGCES